MVLKVNEEVVKIDAITQALKVWILVRYTLPSMKDKIVQIDRIEKQRFPV